MAAPSEVDPLSSMRAVLDAAAADYAQGRYEAALGVARRLEALEPQPVAAGPGAWRAEVSRLRCLAAFRLGEVAEAAAAAETFLAVAPAVPEPVRAGASGAATADAQRMDVLCVSVVAAGETLRFDQALAHLRLAQQTAMRQGTLTAWVRARGTAAAAFTLLGDPWAAQRLAAELAGTFLGLGDQPRLEATARNNHCGTCLLLARAARDAGDGPGATDAMVHAEASLARLREIATAARDPRIAAFADIHEAEMALLRGGAAQALPLLHGALAQAQASGLRGHMRWLALHQAEALVALGDAGQALGHLATLRAELGERHEFGLCIRMHHLLHDAHLAQREADRARLHLGQARALEQQRTYRQLQAQSSHLRARLELEHLYRFRGRTGAAAAGAY